MLWTVESNSILRAVQVEPLHTAFKHRETTSTSCAKDLVRATQEAPLRWHGSAVL